MAIQKNKVGELATLIEAARWAARELQALDGFENDPELKKLWDAIKNAEKVL